MDFYAENRKFLSPFHKHGIEGGVLLVQEPASVLFLNHCTMMQALMLQNAKKLKPVFIDGKSSRYNLAQSYIPESELVKLKRPGFFRRALMKMYSAVVCASIVIFKQYLSFSYDGIYYGDILYDTFLYQRQVSTLRIKSIKDARVLHRIIYNIVVKHVSMQKTIAKTKACAVLAYQMVAIDSAVLIRVGQKMRCEIYINSGLHRNCLRHFNHNEPIVYPRTPTKREISDILNMENFEHDFQCVHSSHVGGNASLDAMYAFPGEDSIQKNRELFCKKHHIDVRKKNIFVMLHAFTDFPHSHFNKMLFDDYGDWFLETLAFAKKKGTDVNWIFKTHPSAKFYPTRDLNLDELFSDAPRNVVLLNPKEAFDARSLEHLADAMITCVGSAGFEMPALYGIPAILAADGPYTGYEFAVLPDSKDAYFQKLTALRHIQPLSRTAQRQARAMYMFMYKYSEVDYTFMPCFTFEEHKNPPDDDQIFHRILDRYIKKKQDIYAELEAYINELSKSDFSVLRTPVS